MRSPASDPSPQTVSSTGALGTAITATVSYNATTHVATLSHATALAANTKYRATLVTGGTAIRDIAGNNMAGNVTWDFTTGA